MEMRNTVAKLLIAGVENCAFAYLKTLCLGNLRGLYPAFSVYAQAPTATQRWRLLSQPSGKACQAVFLLQRGPRLDFEAPTCPCDEMTHGISGANFLCLAYLLDPAVVQT
jgi:predicted alpha/beta-fold hydrolase